MTTEPESADQSNEPTGERGAAASALSTDTLSGRTETGTGAGADAEATSDTATAADAVAEKAAQDPASQADVDIGDPESLARWSQALGMPAEVLQGTVKAVGTRIDRIKDYQTGGIAGDQEDA